MFRRSDWNLPEVPAVSSNLDDAGFSVSEAGRIEEVGNPGEFFKFARYTQHHMNLKREEVVHCGVREVITSELAKLGVEKTYLSGDGGASIARTKPDGPHTAIYTTALPELELKKDVVVVIGEGRQDVGVWAWRTILGPEGLNVGSVIGLAKKLQACPGARMQVLGVSTFILATQMAMPITHHFQLFRSRWRI
jgi:hypothetical protein